MSSATASRHPRDVPPLWQLLAVGVMFGLHRWLPVWLWLPPPWHHAGWLVIAAGMVLLLMSLGRFRAVGTGLRPFTPVTALVVAGPFRWTRNPMYVGLVTVTLGAALCFGTLSPLAVPPILWLVLDRRFVRPEEQFLKRSIGTAYDDYCRRVPRWLGKPQVDG